jgi:hypothetical protein
MGSCELVTTITAIACTITKNYTNEEAALIAAVLTQLGDTIATILAQQDLCSKDEDNDK